MSVRIDADFELDWSDDGDMVLRDLRVRPPIEMVIPKWQARPIAMVIIGATGGLNPEKRP